MVSNITNNHIKNTWKSEPLREITLVQDSFSLFSDKKLCYREITPRVREKERERRFIKKKKLSS